MTIRRDRDAHATAAMGERRPREQSGPATDTGASPSAQDAAAGGPAGSSPTRARGCARHRPTVPQHGPPRTPLPPDKADTPTGARAATPPSALGRLGETRADPHSPHTHAGRCGAPRCPGISAAAGRALALHSPGPATREPRTRAAAAAGPSTSTRPVQRAASGCRGWRVTWAGSAHAQSPPRPLSSAGRAVRFVLAPAHCACANRRGASEPQLFPRGF